MIVIDNTEVYGWEAAIRGMRNPMNSWGKSDTEFSDIIGVPPIIGMNDLKLMKKLADAGPEHGKFLRMIGVTMDVTAPMYWWAQFDSYKVGIVRNSCSKMHKLLEKPFEMNDFSFDMLPGYRNEVKQFRPFIDEEDEVWAPCKIREDYQVSNCGRIRHGKRILSGSLHQDGYIFSTIAGKQYPLHRLIAEVFISNPEHKNEVNHKDGNKQNNHIDNLEWATRRENMIHAVDNHLQPRPTTTYLGKFSEEQRNEIKRLWDSGINKREIARMFGVSHSCINSIVNDKHKYIRWINVFEEIARPIVDTLNELRDSYLNSQIEDDKKQTWYSIMQLLPQSYNQRATIMLNYAVLKNIYRQRKDHKLTEWHDFCDWIRSLPYAEELIIGRTEQNEQDEQNQKTDADRKDVNQNG